MSKHDAFTEEFAKLLATIPDNYSLAQWQFDYRQVIFSMGMKILERFPEGAVGPEPSSLQKAGPPTGQGSGGTIPSGGGPHPGGPHQDGTGGQTGGGHPFRIGDFACLVLGLAPSKPKPPKGGPK